MPASETVPSEPRDVLSTTAEPPLVRLFPNGSFACTAIAEVVTPFAVIDPGEAEITESEAEAAAGDTVTVSRSAPVVVRPPWVTVRSADSAFVSRTEPPALATPFVNVIVVEVPNATGAPGLSVAVGWFEPAATAPPKVAETSPLYPVAVLPDWSTAVIVSDCDCPAVCVPEPVTTKRVAEPTATDTGLETPLLELCEVAVKAPVVALPV